MKKQTNFKLNRRTFLKTLGFFVVGGGLFGRTGLNAQVNHKHTEDTPSGHGMLLFGEQAVYLSHLPMFGNLSNDKNNYTSPHRYQVILEVVFKKDKAEQVQNLYLEERQKEPCEKIYSINPDAFVLPEISPIETPKNTRKSFKAEVFRGHFERGGKIITGLEEVTVEIKNIVHFRRFDPKGHSLENLEYILFGTKEEMFLAHYISQPDNFDQIISIKTDRKFNADELRSGIRLSVPKRKDLATERLREDQKSEVKVSEKNKALNFQMNAVREFYFEEGELFKEAKFE